MNVSKHPIFVFSGHTGGHFFPALSFARQFRKENPGALVHFFLNKKPAFMNRMDVESGFVFHFLAMQAPSSGSVWGKLRAFVRYARIFFLSFSLIWKFKPELIVGFGSFASVPGVLAGSLARIPIVIHEQNLMPGRATEFLSVWADRIAVSFQETSRWLPRDKVVWSGFPIREDFFRLGDEGSKVREDGRFNIFVFGGSQGARRLNEVVVASMGLLLTEEREKIVVTHIVGEQAKQAVTEGYGNMQVECHVLVFSDAIWKHLRQADLVIARSGAGTLFELAATGQTSILIPYPYARAHQEANAAHMASQGAAHVLLDEFLTPGQLSLQIRNLYSNPTLREELAKKMSGFCEREAAGRLVTIGKGLACQNN